MITAIYGKWRQPVVTCRPATRERRSGSASTAGEQLRSNRVERGACAMAQARPSPIAPGGNVGGGGSSAVRGAAMFSGRLSQTDYARAAAARRGIFAAGVLAIPAVLYALESIAILSARILRVAGASWAGHSLTRMGEGKRATCRASRWPCCAWRPSCAPLRSSCAPAHFWPAVGRRWRS